MPTKTKRRTKPTLPPLGGEPADWQEQHSPTEAVMVKISGTRQMTQGRRRREDSRIWSAMTGDEERAAVAIEWCHRFRTSDVAVKVARYTDQPGGGRRHDAPLHPIRLERLRAYDEWRRMCPQATDAVAIICEGEGLHAQDRRKRQRNGDAREGLRWALGDYNARCRVPDIRTLAPSGKEC